MILSYRYRIKDATTGKRLDDLSRSVNCVWNYCGVVHEASRRHNKRWPSAFDMIKLTTGSGTLLGLHSDTVQAVCKQFVSSRNLHRKRPRWRGKKSLGWIPFAAGRAIKIDGDSVIYLGRRYRFWNSRGIDGHIHAGCFSCDASGRWFISLQVEVEENSAVISGSTIGIDLGLSTLATCSDGTRIANPRHLRKHAHRLAKAQRAGRKRHARAIHRKIAAARRHFLHVETTRLVRRCRHIVVGKINSAKLVRTRMARSVLDASWSILRNQLRYKARRHGVQYEERSEWLTTQVCSDCGNIGGPRGLKDLGVREWTCSHCGTLHDRDVNAAKNILGLEHGPPVVGNLRPSNPGKMLSPTFCVA